MTAHLLNKHLKWKSYALACSRFKGSHTYDRIAEKHNGVFARYKIAVDRKVRGVLTDNASNFSKAFREYPIVSDEDVQVSDEQNEGEVGQNGSFSFTNIREILDSHDDPEYFQLPPHFRCVSHTLNLLGSTDVDKALCDMRGSTTPLF